MKYLILLSLFACATRYVPTNDPNTEVIRPEVDPIKAEATEVLKPSIPFLTVSRCTNCTQAQSDRIFKSTDLLNKIVASDCVKEMVLTYPFIDTNGKSNKEILEIILNDGVNIETETYYTIKRVLGYTLEGVNKVWINRRTMMGWSELDLASLLFHESLHKLGFTHTFNYTKGREHSVPYAGNTIIEGCGK